MAGRIEQAEREMINNISTAIYSDGTGSSGKQLGGLALLVSDDGTGTVGGIVSGTYTWWKNYFYDFSVKSITPSATTIQAAMNDAYLNTMRNRDRVDLIIADNTYYTYYWSSLQTNQRFTNPRLGEAGFDNLKFQSADVVADGGFSGAATASHMFFLNTNYIFYRPHSQRNMVPLNPERYATNQDALVKLIGFAGNMTVSNRSLQAAIVA